jgi:hypothetical protein
MTSSKLNFLFLTSKNDDRNVEIKVSTIEHDISSLPGQLSLYKSTSKGFIYIKKEQFMCCKQQKGEMGEKRRQNLGKAPVLAARFKFSSLFFSCFLTLSFFSACLLANGSSPTSEEYPIIKRDC